MALSEEQLKAIREQHGITPAPTPTSNVATDRVSRFDTAWADTPAPKTETPHEMPSVLGASVDYAKNVGENAIEGGKKFGKSFGDVYNASTDTSRGLADRFMGILKGSLGMASGGISTIFSPVTGAFKSASDIPAGDGENIGDKANKALQAKGGIVDVISNSPKLQQFMVEHPDADTVVGDLINVLGAVYGGKKAPEIKSALMEGLDKTTNAMSTASEIVSNKVGDIKNNMAAKADQTAVNDALEIIKPTLNKKGAIAAFENAGKPGGIEAKGKTSTYSYTPDANDIKVANAVKDVVSKKNGPIDNLIAINNKIADVSENVVGKHLAENKVPFNFEDLRNSLELTKPSSSFKNDPQAFETYSRVREETLSSIYNTLKDAAKKKSDFGNATDFNDVWNARKVIDEKINNELGDATFGTPQYTGIKAAARDIRESFSKFIVDSLSNPGQMERVNQMQDFLQTARSRGIDIPNEQAAMNALKEQFGINQSDADLQRAAVFKDSMDQLNSMYDARGNIAESNYKLLDKNGIQRWIKQNPAKAKLLLKGLGIVGLGLVGKEILSP